MKNRIVKKIMRTLLLVIIFAAVGGTFYFLWQKAQPVITVYEIVTPTIGNVETKAVATGNVEPRYDRADTVGGNLRGCHQLHLEHCGLHRSALFQPIQDKLRDKIRPRSALKEVFDWLRIFPFPVT